MYRNLILSSSTGVHYRVRSAANRHATDNSGFAERSADSLRRYVDLAKRLAAESSGFSTSEELTSLSYPE